MPRSIVDLSPVISRDLPALVLGEKAAGAFGIPLSLPFELHVAEEPFYLSMSAYTIFSHVGPHYDPPNHIIKGGASVEDAPLDKFYGRARLFDFRAKTAGEPLLRSDFDGAGIEPGEIVIAFVGYEAPKDKDAFPSYAYLSGDAAEYLASIPIKAFASDLPSLGSITGYFALIEEGKTGSENILPEHYAFASRDIPNIEGLVNLHAPVRSRLHEGVARGDEVVGLELVQSQVTVIAPRTRELNIGDPVAASRDEARELQHVGHVPAVVPAVESDLLLGAHWIGLHDQNGLLHARSSSSFRASRGAERSWLSG